KELITNNIIDTIDSLDIGAKVDYTMFISSLYRNTGNAVSSFTDLQFWIDPNDKKTLGDFIQPNKNELMTLLSTNVTIEVL
ncbi:MAG: hypothetical protein ACRCX2_32750, partial [Paraclostridium sp.]